MKPTKEEYSEALQALIERRATLSVPAQESDADLVVSRYVMGLEDEIAKLRAICTGDVTLDLPGRRAAIRALVDEFGIMK